MKKKLKLNHLNVSSFITKQNILGGAPAQTKRNCPPDPESFDCSGAATSSPCICVTCDLACEFTYDPDLCVITP